MGLDMYLSKKIYVGAEYDHRKVEGKIEITTNGKPLKINFKKVAEITERVAYWRKANQIHAWFVKNCQDGKDECQETYVEREKLEELLEICKRIKRSKGTKLAEKLLPPQGGFFFGSTELGEYYMQDIENTIEVLTEVLGDENDGGDFYYRASW